MGKNGLDNINNEAYRATIQECKELIKNGTDVLSQLTFTYLEHDEVTIVKFPKDYMPICLTEKVNDNTLFCDYTQDEMYSYNGRYLGDIIRNDNGEIELWIAGLMLEEGDICDLLTFKVGDNEGVGNLNWLEILSPNYIKVIEVVNLPVVLDDEIYRLVSLNKIVFLYDGKYYYKNNVNDNSIRFINIKPSTSQEDTTYDELVLSTSTKNLSYVNSAFITVNPAPVIGSTTFTGITIGGKTYFAKKYTKLYRHRISIDGTYGGNPYSYYLVIITNTADYLYDTPYGDSHTAPNNTLELSNMVADMYDDLAIPTDVRIIDMYLIDRNSDFVKLNQIECLSSETHFSGYQASTQSIITKAINTTLIVTEAMYGVIEEL